MNKESELLIFSSLYVKKNHTKESKMRLLSLIWNQCCYTDQRSNYLRNMSINFSKDERSVISSIYIIYCHAKFFSGFHFIKWSGRTGEQRENNLI